MDIQHIQKLVIANAERYSDKHNIPIDLDWLLLKLVEENGEFANALLVYTKKCRSEKMVSDEVAKDNLSKELVDIFTTTILLADRLDIDLLKSLDEKVLQKAQKYLDEKE